MADLDYRSLSKQTRNRDGDAERENLDYPDGYDGRERELGHNRNDGRIDGRILVRTMERGRCGDWTVEFHGWGCGEFFWFRIWRGRRRGNSANHGRRIGGEYVNRDI